MEHESIHEDQESPTYLMSESGFGGQYDHRVKFLWENDIKVSEVDLFFLSHCKVQEEPEEGVKMLERWYEFGTVERREKWKFMDFVFVGVSL